MRGPIVFAALLIAEAQLAACADPDFVIEPALIDDGDGVDVEIPATVIAANGSMSA